MNLEQRYPLSKKSLQIIMSGEQVPEPLMQVLGCKKIMVNSDKERYRILLSDGFFYISYAMLTTHANHKLPEGGIETNTVIKLKNYATSVITNAGKGDKRVLVIVDMDIVATGSEVGQKLGEPQQLPEGFSTELSNVNGNASSSSINIATPSVSSATTRNSFVSNTNQNSMNNGSNNSMFQDELVNPISSLSPYHNKWIIKARVTNKSSIRTWSNSRGEGKLFSIDLIDETGEIRATMFRDLVDKYYDTIEVDKVYYISKGQLKLANKQYNTLNNDYEMTVSNDTIIQECLDSSSASLPKTQFNFEPIAKISELDIGSFIDVIGICKEASDITTIQARSTGRELKKREVTLVDQSNNSIVLTLWGSDAEKFDSSRQAVLAIKGAKTGEFGGGKTLSALSSSIIKIDPDIPEAHRLRGWFDNGGMNNEAINISARTGAGGGQLTQWLSFKDVEKQGLGNAERGGYYQVMATILLLQGENIVYKACPTSECNKKLMSNQNGMYTCTKCGRDYPNFKYNMLAKLNIGDWSGNQWVSMFCSEVEKILGMTAQEVGEKIDENSEAALAITDKAHFKQYIFKCRIKTEMYNDEARLKTVVLRADPINYQEYHSQYLIPRIEELLK